MSRIKTDHLDELANQYHKTKDPYYKDLWYNIKLKILTTKIFCIKK